jgi:hypothetical protein
MIFEDFVLLVADRCPEATDCGRIDMGYVTDRMLEHGLVLVSPDGKEYAPSRHTPERGCLSLYGPFGDLACIVRDHDYTEVKGWEVRDRLFPDCRLFSE